MAGGRPTDYKPEYCQMLVDHMKTGKSYILFALKANVSVQTLYDWEKAYPEFLEAKKAGFLVGQDFWEQAGLDGMREKVFHDSLWIFNMKNRFKWRDRHDEDLTRHQIPFVFAYEIEKKKEEPEPEPNAG